MVIFNDWLSYKPPNENHIPVAGEGSERAEEKAEGGKKWRVLYQELACCIKSYYEPRKRPHNGGRLDPSAVDLRFPESVLQTDLLVAAECRLKMAALKAQPDYLTFSPSIFPDSRHDILTAFPNASRHTRARSSPAR